VVGGEIAVVVVDVDEIDILAFKRHRDEPGHGSIDVGDVGIRSSASSCW